MSEDKLIKIGIIIFSRMSSKRLPFKALQKINGEELVLRAFNSCRHLKKKIPIILATSKNPEDDKLCEFAKNKFIEIYRGSLDNLVDRAYKTCLEYKLTHFIRFCGDRPLFPRSLIDLMLNSINNYDMDLLSSKFSSNQLPPGLTAEIVSIKSLKYINENTINKNHLEHLTSFIYENMDNFKTEALQNIPLLNWDNMKFVVDTEDDLKKINFISKKIDPNLHSYNINKSLNKLNFLHHQYTILSNN